MLQEPGIMHQLPSLMACMLPLHLPPRRLWKGKNANDQDDAEDHLKRYWEPPLERSHVLQEPEAIVLGFAS